jgi:hypothetical protein
VADAFDGLHHPFVSPQTNRSPPVKVAIQYLAFDCDTVTLKDNSRPGLEFLSRVHQGFPVHLGALDSGLGTGGSGLGTRRFEVRGFEVPRLSKRAHQQTLHGTSARHAMSEEPGGKHAGVIQHQPVAAVQELRKLAEHRVRDGTGAPVEHEQARLTALSRRMLSDELLRKLEIEVGDAHGGQWILSGLGAVASGLGANGRNLGLAQP